VSLYDSPRLAAGYAVARPPVHAEIIARIAARVAVDRRAGRALDLGCGVGLSTAPLRPLAERVVGLEPSRTMLAHAVDIAPEARLVRARVEGLPFASGTFALVTAAGALNYADPGRALSEIARVLAARGLLAIYDFSPGRRFRDGEELGRWSVAFEQRYPPPPGYALDVRTLPYDRHGLRLAGMERWDMILPMRREAYVSYVLTETCVELALSRGVPEDAIRAWCGSTLVPVFGDAPRDVVFDAYVAFAERRGTEA
jgi:SAM-dependent methyltransferase